MIPNHPEPEQILLENVLFALGNPLRLAIIRRLADGSELSCNALRPDEVVKSTMTHHWRVLRDSGVIWQRPQGAREYDFTEKRRSGRPLSGADGNPVTVEIISALTVALRPARAA